MTRLWSHIAFCMICDLLLELPQPVRADDYCPCDQLPRTVLCRTSGYRNLKYPSMPIRNCDYFDNESSMNKNTLDKPEPCSCSEVTREKSYSVWV